MNANTIWGNYGRFAPAHEYGHALHEKALGGNRGGNCPDAHYLRQASNHSCAFSEGFADFHAALTIGMEMASGAPGYYDWSLSAAEGTWKNSSGGTATEANVGAFFLDLADDSGTPDTIAGDDDAASYGGAYVGRAIKECWITWQEDTSQLNEDGIVQEIYQPANDVLDLVHCMEGQIVPSGRTTAGSVDSQGNIITLDAVRATSITQASGWSASTVQAIWDANF